MKARFRCLIVPAILIVAGKTSVAGAHEKLSTLVDNFFGKGIALLINQRFEREESVPAYFKEYALRDVSNDNIAKLSAQQIIERSGFHTESHRSIANDGYVTEMIRIINPLADQRKLKGPPVMLLQGGISDQAIWIWASSGQHHPEKYPRLAEDGPMTSWNRSLAFVLANNGYDVWLIGTRGSNEGNSGHLKLKHKEDWLAEPKRIENSTNLSDVAKKDDLGLFEKLKYWEYTLDELANFELPRQIKSVLKVTRSDKVTLVPISMSSIITIMFITAHPEYKKRVHNSVVMMPIINNEGTNKVLGSFHRRICSYLPSQLGNILFPEILFSKLAREAMLLVGKRKSLRYSLIKGLMQTWAGPSAKYQTLLEPTVYCKILMPTSFKQIKHYCQVVRSGELRWYDHGPMKNEQLYGSTTPRKYDKEQTDFGNWMVVSGGNDKFATVSSVQQYIRTSKTPPKEHIFIKHYNHLDVIAALDNDIRVNLPVLEYLDQNYMRTAHNHSDELEEYNVI